MPPMGMVVSRRGAGNPTDCANDIEAQPRETAHARTIGWNCRDIITMAFLLVVEKKFLGIKQRPDQVLKILARGLLRIHLLASRINPRLGEVT